MSQEGEDEIIPPIPSSPAPLSVKQVAQEEGPVEVKDGKRKSSRIAIAASKAKEIRQQQEKQKEKEKQRLKRKRDRDREIADGSDEDDFPQIASYDDDEDEDEDEDDGLFGNQGILSKPEEGGRWLIPKEDFPWDEVDWFLDESIGEEMILHLTKRIEKMQGTIADDMETADIILINPHPAQLNADRSQGMSNLGHVQQRLCIILPYTYLARCYFSKKVERVDTRQPVFLNEGGSGCRVMVMKLGNADGMDGEKRRRGIMIGLESNGAMIVSSLKDADVCIVPSTHPYLQKPPTADQYKHVAWHSLEWVEERIKIVEDEVKLKAKPRAKSKSDPKPKILRPNTVKPISKWNEGIDSKIAIRGHASSSYASGDHKNFTWGRSATRTEFTPSDRDFLARWLAYNRPDTVGRTTRSLYFELERFRPASPWHHIASRHPASAWHEHFKRNRGKLGMDGKILEEEVDQYVKKGVNGTLKTKSERDRLLKSEEKSATGRKQRSKAKGKGGSFSGTQRADDDALEVEDDEHEDEDEDEDEDDRRDVKSKKPSGKKRKSISVKEPHKKRERSKPNQNQNIRRARQTTENALPPIDNPKENMANNIDDHDDDDAQERSEQGNEAAAAAEDTSSDSLRVDEVLAGPADADADDIEPEDGHDHEGDDAHVTIRGQAAIKEHDLRPRSSQSTSPRRSKRTKRD
ncbi:uncharacterized protein I303_108650 [Kwoniella dejecticola CBS 10117]|uniref:Uncharacterized protein n=1 Tax=Kwoniella dejecticola CBS 10117 TaxID=1296121 RepID=A0A1A5ZWT3_9TREE|nr:uncharacterized protein I303_07025 [Kwoniella dejecticola CBS 10117]OBR82266.1 hypothetical protein I303_07025 [Kwoniella dejecticola CBS 10117]